ncbi:hypothetical protein A3Q56_04101 [Intoshia linei]|uniref:signal peptidase I n=1 Tax=Intoshia linei TaxID=1819745 RepID=A0A177B1Y0_9BILA|nr:hypothetical protein A3Q56_04101 [Intoshia linei]
MKKNEIPPSVWHDMARVSTENISSQSTSFIGGSVQIEKFTYKIRTFIADGGFGSVFKAQNVKDNSYVAIKRMFANNKDTHRAIIKELKLLKKLSGHPNIVTFIAGAGLTKKNGKVGLTEYLLLTEYCPVLLMNVLNSDIDLNSVQILHMFYQLTSAVNFIHSQSMPLIHRDLKMDNILVNDKGILKLIDFGSMTVNLITPQSDWSTEKYMNAETEIDSFTTPIYRAPEMYDLYQLYPIDTKSDIWALGCILFCMTYKSHPFETSGKLAIINCKYHYPSIKKSEQYTKVNQFIEKIFILNPLNRPSAEELMDMMNFVLAKYNYLEPLSFLAKKIVSKWSDSEIKFLPSNLSVYKTMSKPMQSVNPAESVVEPKQQNIATEKLQNLEMEKVNKFYKESVIDFDFITPRIAVMSFPSPDSKINCLQSVETYLNERFENNYAIYNITNTSFHKDSTLQRVSECGSRCDTNLSYLIAIYDNIVCWLGKNKCNIGVINCKNGFWASCAVICGLLIYGGVFSHYLPPLILFQEKRKKKIKLYPSQYRYLTYIMKIKDEMKKNNSIQNLPTNIIKLNSILFINANDKLYSINEHIKVEIFCNSNKVNHVYFPPDKLKNDFKIDIETYVSGDVVILFSAPSFKDEKKKYIDLFSISFHTSFIDRTEKTTQLVFKFKDIDVFYKNASCELTFITNICMDSSLNRASFTSDITVADLLNCNQPTFKLVDPIIFFGNKRFLKETISQYENLSIIEKDNFVNFIQDDFVFQDPSLKQKLHSTTKQDSVDLLNTFSNSAIIASKSTSDINTSETSPICRIKSENNECTASLLNIDSFVQNDGVNVAYSYTNVQDVLEPSKMSNQKPKQKMELSTKTSVTPKYDIPINRKPDSPKKTKFYCDEPKKEQSNDKSINDMFSDLLKPHNFQTENDKNKKTNLTLKDIRYTEKAKFMDPNTLAVNKWKEGKEENIRALVSTIHTLPWPIKLSIQPVSMANLLSVSQVKKAYRKIVVHIHPDKNIGSQNETLAKLVSIKIKENSTQLRIVTMFSSYFSQVKKLNSRQVYQQFLSLAIAVSTALAIWKSTMLVSGSESPIVVVLSGSMEPAFWRGDIMFVYHNEAEGISVGDIVIFNFDTREIPIVHRALEVHTYNNGTFEVLTKGDNNNGNDRPLYPPGVKFVRKEQFLGKPFLKIPTLGMLTILFNDYPTFKFGVLGTLAFFLLLHRE